MEEKQSFQANSVLDDEMEAQMAELMREVAALRAKPIAEMLPRAGSFDGLVEDLNHPPLPAAEPVVADEAEAEAAVARVFREMDEGEKSCGELEQELEQWQPNATEPTIAREEPMAAGQPVADSPEAMSAGALAAGAAVLAGAGILVAKMTGKTATEPQLQWYYALNGQQYGPLTEAELTAKLSSGEFLFAGHVWREGWSQWLPVNEAGLAKPPERSAAEPMQAASAQVAEGQEWYYLNAGNQTVGPVSRAAINELLNAKQLGPQSLVWTEGMKEWQTVTAAGLAGTVSSAVTAPPVDLRCPGCGNPLAAGSRFCGKCGKRL